MEDEEVLVTPCCGTRIVPAAGFQSVECCGQHFELDDLDSEAD